MTGRDDILSPPPGDMLSRLLADNPWTPRAAVRDGPITWRHVAAAALRDVPVEAVAERIGPLVTELEALTETRLLAEAEADPERSHGFGFERWYAVWREHFASWQDPVRMLISELAVTEDARWFAQNLIAVNGEVFFDFVLETCLTWANQQRWGRKLGAGCHPAAEHYPLTLDLWRDDHALTLLLASLYERFAEVAPFMVNPLPPDFDVALPFGDLCAPAQPDIPLTTEQGDR